MNPKTIKFLSLLLIFFCSHPIVFAQYDLEQEKEQAHYLFSPFQSMYNHHHNLRYNNFFPEKAANSLSPFANTLTLDARRESAIKLNLIFDANGLVFQEESVPTERDYYDSTAKKNRFTPFPKFPEIYLERVYITNVGFQWFFSKETVEAIPRLYKRTFPYESEAFFKKWKIKETRFLGLNTLHYIGLAVFIIAPFILVSLLNLLVAFILRLLIGKLTEEQQKNRKIRKLSRPISLFTTFLLLEQFIPVFQFPALLTYYIRLFINISQPVFALLMSIGLINLGVLYFEKLAKKRQNIWFEQIIPFLQASLQIVTIIISLVYMLEALNLNVTALIAGLSIGGLAFALAAQDTIKNLFGSVTIFIDRPFKVGDWIIADGIDGDVEEIGLRSTRIRTFNNSIQYVPNGRMADMTIDNMGMRIFRRYKTIVGITYDTPAPLIKAYLRGIKELILNHPNTRKDFCAINLIDFGTSALNIQIYIYIYASDVQTEWNIREEIILYIIELAEALNIRFAFPTQTVHIETFANQDRLTSNQINLSDADLNKKIDDFLKNKIPNQTTENTELTN